MYDVPCARKQFWHVSYQRFPVKRSGNVNHFHARCRVLDLLPYNDPIKWTFMEMNVFTERKTKLKDRPLTSPGSIFSLKGKTSRMENNPFSVIQSVHVNIVYQY